LKTLRFQRQVFVHAESSQNVSTAHGFCPQPENRSFTVFSVDDFATTTTIRSAFQRFQTGWKGLLSQNHPSGRPYFPLWLIEAAVSAA
jgi:hypothetical protein